jgi:hypothetical protein
MNILIRLNLFLLLAVAVFDPSDLLIHAKVPLFIGVWVLFLIDMVISAGGRYQVPAPLYRYLFLFVVLLPLIGMFVYAIRGQGMEGYEGFRYYKSYLFLTLCVPLVVKRIDLIRPLSFILSVLSAATIFLSVLTLSDDVLRGPLAAFGDAFVIFNITDRSYGDLSYQLLYFHASPLLVIAIVYFCHCFLSSTGWSRLWSALFLTLNVCGMVLSGTRNNMIVGIAAPLVVLAWYRGKGTRLAIAGLVVMLVAVGFSFGVIQAMLSPEDYGNAIKLGHLHDYSLMFSDWKTLLFGQGLGATFFSTAWGTRVSVTELTYVEIIRNYGVLMALVFYALILYPVRMLANPKVRGDHYLYLGYVGYLYLCSANPFLLSSTGMLVLSVVLCTTFSDPLAVRWRGAQRIPRSASVRPCPDTPG